MITRARHNPARSELTLHFAGALDLCSAPHVAEAVHAHYTPDCARVRLDVSAVNFCDCAGLSSLIQAHHAVTDAGAHPAVTGAAGRVHRLVQAAGAQWLYASTDPHRHSRARHSPAASS